MKNLRSLIFNHKSEIINLKSYLYLDRLSWLLLSLAMVLDIILWLIRSFRIHYNITLVLFTTAVLILNTILTILFGRKDILISYFLLGTALLVQVFALILLKNTII